MITLTNNLDTIGKARLEDLLIGTFFKFENEIYQRLVWENASESYVCCCVPDMRCTRLSGNIYVRQVDVQITVTGYTKED